jgi:hypothetical protein
MTRVICVVVVVDVVYLTNELEVEEEVERREEHNGR